jgi:hypothetical protein
VTTLPAFREKATLAASRDNRAPGQLDSGLRRNDGIPFVVPAQAGTQFPQWPVVAMRRHDGMALRYS